jgi:predicted transcriptional regulator
LPLFRSQTQLDILGALFAAPAPITISDLAVHIGAPVSTVSREVARLAEAGIVQLVSEHRTKLVEARRDFSWAPALAELLDRTVGVAAAVEEAFSALDDVDLVAIFGSWAERRLGRLGAPPRDIDILVVGEPSGMAVAGAATQAGRRLGLDVTPHVVSPDQWRKPKGDPVLSKIKTGPLVILWPRPDHG